MINKPHPALKKKDKTGAFSLVEIMYVTGIISIIGLILTSFMRDSARSMSWSVDKSLITRDFRLFTMNVTQDAYNANFAYLYPSLNLADRDESSDQRGLGQSGDCLVLVKTEPFPSTNSQRFFRQIIIYYRQVTASGDMAVLRQVIDFTHATESTANVGNTTNPNPNPDFFEDFLNRQMNRTNLNPPETVLESTRGLAGDHLFLLLDDVDGTFLINGEIINGLNADRITNTYNLTISTRG